MASEMLHLKEVEEKKCSVELILLCRLKTSCKVMLHLSGIHINTHTHTHTLFCAWLYMCALHDGQQADRDHHWNLQQG